MIWPVKFVGRGGECKKLAESRIWTAAWGVLEMEDYHKKLKLALDEAEMKAKKVKAKARKAKPEKVKLNEVKLDLVSKLEMSDGMGSGEVKCGPPILLADPRNEKDEQGMYKN